MQCSVSKFIQMRLVALQNGHIFLFFLMLARYIEEPVLGGGDQ